MIRKVLVLLGLLAALASPALADLSTIQNSGSFTATGTVSTLYLGGQSSCSVVLSGTGTGLTVVPQVTSDSAANISAGTAAWVTASTIGAGSLTANGTFVGNIAAQGLTGFRLNVTGITGGTESYVSTCSPANASSGGGGSVTLPFTGGSTSNANAANQGVAIFAYNGATNDAVQALNGSLNIRGTQAAGTPGTSALTVQGISGGTAIPVSGSFSANSTVVSSPATFVAGNQPPPQADLNGAIYEHVINPTTFAGNATPGAAGANAYLPVACQFTGGNTATATQVTPVQCDASGNLAVNLTAGLGSVIGNPLFTKITNGTNTPNVASPGSDGAGVSPALYTEAYNALYNGSTWDRQRKDSFAAGPAWVTSGGSTYNTLNSGSATACTNIGVGASRLEKVWETTSTEAVTLTLYDEGASPTCAAADIIATLTNLPLVSPANQPINFDMVLVNGLSYKLSAALTGAVKITRY